MEQAPPDESITTHESVVCLASFGRLFRCFARLSNSAEVSASYPTLFVLAFFFLMLLSSRTDLSRIHGVVQTKIAKILEGC